MKCIFSFSTIIKCLNILWKLFSEIYFKIPSVFILKLEFPALHREWHKSREELHMQMENATRSPSLILPFFQSQDQPHKDGTACCIHANGKCHWTPLHHAWYSFKVPIKCGKDGSVNFKQEDPETCFFLQMIHIIQMKQLITKEMIRNQFFFQIQLLANGLVHCKEDGLEQNFSYEVRNYA